MGFLRGCLVCTLSLLDEVYFVSESGDSVPNVVFPSQFLNHLQVLKYIDNVVNPSTLHLQVFYDIVEPEIHFLFIPEVSQYFSAQFFQTFLFPFVLNRPCRTHVRHVLLKFLPFFYFLTHLSLLAQAFWRRCQARVRDVNWLIHLQMIAGEGGLSWETLETEVKSKQTAGLEQIFHTVNLEVYNINSAGQQITIITPNSKAAPEQLTSWPILQSNHFNINPPALSVKLNYQLCPFLMIQTFIFCLIGAFIGISQSAGIGGGPVINLCLMLGLGYSSKVATALTYIFLMGGSCASYLQNMRKRRPDGTLLIDYQLIVLTLPMIMSGSLFGSILRRFLSQFVITIIFTVLLIYLTHTSYQGYKRVVNNETANEPDSPIRQALNQSHAADLHPILTSSLQQNKQAFQKDKIKIILYTILYTVVILLVRGGLKYQSVIGLQACGFGFWVCNALHLVISLLVTKSVAIQQFKLQNQQIKFGLQIRQSMRMNDVKMRETSFYGFLAGTLGGAIGLGGAIILVPIWLRVGYHRDVAAASTSPLIFCSAFCSFLVSAFSGRYTWFIFIEFFSISFFSAWIVKSIITWVTNRFHLKAVGYVLLIITMVSSLLTLLPYEVSSYLRSPQEFMAFGILC